MNTRIAGIPCIINVVSFDPGYPARLNGHPDVLGACNRNTTLRITEEIAQKEGFILMAENVRSVNCRYGGDDKPDFLLNEEAFSNPPNTVAALKAVDGLEYQSCEADSWETSEAYKLLRRIRSSLIKSLPGYGEAPWGIG